MMPELVIIFTILSAITIILFGLYEFFLSKRRSWQKLVIFMMLTLATYIAMNSLAIMPVVETTKQWTDANNITYIEKKIEYGENPYNWLFFIPMIINTLGVLFYGFATVLKYLEELGKIRW